MPPGIEGMPSPFHADVSTNLGTLSVDDLNSNASNAVDPNSSEGFSTTRFATVPQRTVFHACGLISVERLLECAF